MSREALATSAKLTVRYVRKVEGDPEYNLKRKTMIQLAEALGIPASVLFFPDEQLPSRKLMTGLMQHAAASRRTARAARPAP